MRLPDDLVDFMTHWLGEETSRASIVARALKRERRRLGALRDIEIRSDPNRMKIWTQWSRTLRTARLVSISATDSHSL